jgi:hypothetical protein
MCGGRVGRGTAAICPEPTAILSALAGLTGSTCNGACSPGCYCLSGSTSSCQAAVRLAVARALAAFVMIFLCCPRGAVSGGNLRWVVRPHELRLQRALLRGVLVPRRLKQPDAEHMRGGLVRRRRLGVLLMQRLLQRGVLLRGRLNIHVPSCVRRRDSLLPRGHDIAGFRQPRLLLVRPERQLRVLHDAGHLPRRVLLPRALEWRDDHLPGGLLRRRAGAHVGHLLGAVFGGLQLPRRVHVAHGGDVRRRGCVRACGRARCRWAAYGPRPALAALLLWARYAQPVRLL